MIEIKIYSKPYCHLCDEMKIVLENVRKDHEFELIEINIETDESLFEKYKELIPLLFVNGKKFAKYRIDKNKLLAKLYRESKTT